MFKNAKLRADQLLQAEWDVMDWFKKHQDSQVKICDINLFAIPYANASDCQVVVSRLVRVGELKRHVEQIAPFVQSVFYTSNR